MLFLEKFLFSPPREGEDSRSGAKRWTAERERDSAHCNQGLSHQPPIQNWSQSGGGHQLCLPQVGPSSESGVER